jgi:hypothetical protein
MCRQSCYYFPSFGPNILETSVKVCSEKGIRLRLSFYLGLIILLSFLQFCLMCLYYICWFETHADMDAVYTVLPLIIFWFMCPVLGEPYLWDDLAKVRLSMLWGFKCHICFNSLMYCQVKILNYTLSILWKMMLVSCLRYYLHHLI